MDKEKDWITPADLPFDLHSLEQEYGSVEQAELKCPGIYYLRVAPPAEHLTNVWLYIVTGDAPISKEARQFGKPAPEQPELRLFERESRDCHWMVIEYEILRYRAKNKLPLGEFDNLHTASAYGMEVCPEYFGTYPVPSLTPWGYTARHKTIHNGVYWIETDQCVSTLAVCYVIRDNFSEMVLSLSELTEYDKEHGLDNTLGYCFFREADSCLPLLELLQDNDQWDWSLINRPALMNAVWARFPEYAAAYNMREQQGRNDGFGMMLRALGIETELRRSQENMIMLTPDSGVQFLNFL